MTLHIHCDDPAAQPWLTALLQLPDTGIDSTPYSLRRAALHDRRDHDQRDHGRHDHDHRDAAHYCLETTDTPAHTLAQGTLGEVFEVTARLIGERCATTYQAGLALHAGCVVKDGQAIIIPGASGAGKTTLTAWLLHRGYRYLTDELTLVPANEASLAGWSRPLHVKSGALPLVASWARACQPLCYPHGAFIPAQAFSASPGTQAPSGTQAPLGTQASPGIQAPSGIQAPPATQAPSGTMPPLTATQPRNLRSPSPAPAPDASQSPMILPTTVLFPHFDAQASLHVQPLTAAQAARRLWDVTANTARLPERGFRQVTALARRLRARALTYADVTELDFLLAEL